MSGSLVAFAIVRDDPPTVFVAEDLDVLQRLLALKVVARTDTARLPPAEVAYLRTALLEERWGDAVARWIRHVGIPVDVYTERVATDEDVPPGLIGAQLQFTPLFRGA
ncbi:MAG TPA: hypothetical protein ENK55_09570 [Actinobacteria bacterium]|nr:hypothetical protein [Actinomycetota bacterium]